jgi:hypothetical protein
MTLSDWSDDELAANRRGDIPESQLAKIRGRLRNVVIAAAVVIAVMIAFVGVFFIARGEGAMRLAGVGFAAFVAIGGGVAIALTWRRFMRDLHGSDVVAVTGVVTIQRRTRLDNKGTVTLYAIAGREIRPLYNGLEKLDGKTATVYMLPHSKLVIAMEPA